MNNETYVRIIGGPADFIGIGKIPETPNNLSFYKNIYVDNGDNEFLYSYLLVGKETEIIDNECEIEIYLYQFCGREDNSFPSLKERQNYETN